MAKKAKTETPKPELSGVSAVLRTSTAFEDNLKEFILDMASREYYTMNRTEAVRRLLGLGIASWRKSREPHQKTFEGVRDAQSTEGPGRAR